MMQAMCFCWLCCVVHFVTNTYQLFITNGAHVLKKHTQQNLFICLTLGFIIKNLVRLFALSLRENVPQLKTDAVTVVICST